MRIQEVNGDPRHFARDDTRISKFLVTIFLFLYKPDTYVSRTRFVGPYLAEFNLFVSKFLSFIYLYM